MFRIVRWFVWLFYPKIKIEGTENIPDEPCIIVGNHSQMNGPIVGEIHFPLHTVVPYRNIPKRNYPKNKTEGADNREKAGC